MQFIRKLFKSNNLLRKLLAMNKLIESKIPLVIIIGATGSRKTQLSIEIAKQFNGEIISADSMQVYKGLDIVTNKASLGERQQIPHHLIDFLEPFNRFSVVDFRNRALDLIDKLRSDDKLPIIVGGTNYYIESVLWQVLVINEDINEINEKQCLLFDRDLQLSQKFNTNENSNEINKENVLSFPLYYDRFENVSSEKLYKILEEIDPNSALRLHPNDKRKIIRCLQVYQQNKKLFSELISDQKSLKGGSELGGPLRYTNSVILWLDCDKKVLDKRLDKRVDDMIEMGLIRELLDFHQKYNRERIGKHLNADYTKGIFQSIGFKEFHNYLILDEELRNSTKSESLVSEGVKEMKLRTKRYVNKQIKWIRNRFLKLNDREVPDIYRLNTTNLDEWKTEVSEPAFAIVNKYLNQSSLPNNLMPLKKIEMNKYISTQFHCHICDKLLCGSNSYESHLKSKGHKYKLNYEKNMKKQKYYELISLLKSHRINLMRRNSI